MKSNYGSQEQPLATRFMPLVEQQQQMGKDKKKKKAAASADSKAKGKSDTKIEAHAGLVEAFSGHDNSLEAARTYLVQAGEIIQEEQLSKEEVIASLMEARDITEKTAREQYSRMKGIFKDAETLQQLKDGEITLKQAREKTKKTQKSDKSKAQKQQSLEKKLGKCVKDLVGLAKETGSSRETILGMVKDGLKEGGVK